LRFNIWFSGIKKGEVMNEVKKPSVKPAAVGSIAVVAFTLTHSAMEIKSDIVEIVRFFFVLFLAGCVIAEWVKYSHKYVDFAIEQKLNERDKEGKD
jgi:hypothetical protein